MAEANTFPSVPALKGVQSGMLLGMQLCSEGEHLLSSLSVSRVCRQMRHGVSFHAHMCSRASVVSPCG